MREMNNYIELREVELRKGRKQILHNITLDIRQGKTLAVLGPNGAGKSSLIELILRDHRPSSGHISYDFDTGIVFKRKLGILYNNQFIFPQLYVREVVDFYKRIYADDGKYLEDLMELFQIKSLLNSRVRTLSEGEKKKLGIVLALFHKPELVVMDEPFANLDVAFIDKLWVEIKKNNATAVIATHDWDYAEKYADEFLFMESGCILGRKFTLSEKNAMLPAVKKIVVPKNKEVAEIIQTAEYYEQDDYLHILLTPVVSLQSIRKYTHNYSVLDLSIRDIYQYLTIVKN